MANKELKKKSKEILITKQGGNQKEGGSKCTLSVPI